VDIAVLSLGSSAGNLVEFSSNHHESKKAVQYIESWLGDIGPKSHEALHELNPDHLKDLIPLLDSFMFNGTDSHEWFHDFWVSHRSLPAQEDHSRELFDGWMALKDAPSHEDRKEAFIRWICDSAPHYVVDTFVPNAARYRKSTRQLTTHIHALGNAGLSSSLPHLQKFFNHSAYEVRQAAVAGLRRMPSREAEAALLFHVNDYDPYVREEAVDALTQRSLDFSKTLTHRSVHEKLEEVLITESLRVTHEVEQDTPQHAQAKKLVHKLYNYFHGVDDSVAAPVLSRVQQAHIDYMQETNTLPAEYMHAREGAENQGHNSSSSAGGGRRLLSVASTAKDAANVLAKISDALLMELYIKLGFMKIWDKVFGSEKAGAIAKLQLKNAIEFRLSLFGISMSMDFDNEAKAAVGLLGFEYVLILGIFDYFMGFTIVMPSATDLVKKVYSYSSDNDAAKLTPEVQAQAVHLRDITLPILAEFSPIMSEYTTGARNLLKQDLFTDAHITTLETAAVRTSDYLASIKTAVGDISNMETVLTRIAGFKAKASLLSATQKQQTDPFLATLKKLDSVFKDTQEILDEVQLKLALAAKHRPQAKQGVADSAVLSALATPIRTWQKSTSTFLSSLGAEKQSAFDSFAATSAATKNSLNSIAPMVLQELTTLKNRINTNLGRGYFGNVTTKTEITVTGIAVDTYTRKYDTGLNELRTAVAQLDSLYIFASPIVSRFEGMRTIMSAQGKSLQHLLHFKFAAAKQFQSDLRGLTAKTDLVLGLRDGTALRTSVNATKNAFNTLAAADLAIGIAVAELPPLTARMKTIGAEIKAGPAAETGDQLLQVGRAIEELQSMLPDVDSFLVHTYKTLDGVYEASVPMQRHSQSAAIGRVIVNGLNQLLLKNTALQSTIATFMLEITALYQTVQKGSLFYGLTKDLYDKFMSLQGRFGRVNDALQKLSVYNRDAAVRIGDVSYSF
jgi:hypothetical protein